MRKYNFQGVLLEPRQKRSHVANFSLFVHKTCTDESRSNAMHSIAYARDLHETIHFPAAGLMCQTIKGV